MNFHLNGSEYIYVDPADFPGVRRIAHTLARDIAAVTGHEPPVCRALQDAPVILCGTLEHSAVLQELAAAGQLDARIRGRREVYQIALCSLHGRTALAICGSDKRGAIYGMFALSEYIGVSPLCFFGDAAPVQRGSVCVEADIEAVSREPSVKYRGFFINDEWPCFGTWATRHYGGVNAQCYTPIFEFLLRMKGNYLWPAMWASSFPLDGPGSANEELADEYGVIMGYSHHEPCLRASEEWDKVRGEGSRYGNAWNFDRNEQGLLNYWEDALRRSGGYENIITIGMRGERDSAILGEGSALKNNIDLLKNVITHQRALIEKNVPRKATQLLALYKEVEAYFYGDDSTPGLKDWPELKDVLFLLCEDNHGHLRTVPPRDMVDHPGGWGMYYHFDYHGDPISYEWVDSTPLAQTWEAMTQAWDFGIRELWIVNVGDLKLHEVPLTYFMQLAYDFDTWGTGHPDSPERYLQRFVKQNFPQADDSLRQQIAGVFRDYLMLNSLRRPEAMNAGIYHPCHDFEADRMLALADGIERRSAQVLGALCPRERDAYYSMIHFSAAASANLCKLHLYAGKNHHYAAQGRVVANRYAELSAGCMERDIALAEEFAAFRAGKWAGMELAPHMGFTKWNEDDSRYPVLCHVTPMRRPNMKVSRADREPVATKNYGTPTVIRADFELPGREEIKIEIGNGGVGQFRFTVAPAPGQTRPAWLCADKWEGTVQELETVTFTCRREALPEGGAQCRLLVSDGDAVVALELTARQDDLSALPPRTFVAREGVVSMGAEDWCEKRDVPGGSFYRIGHYGKYGSGMKVSPSTAAFSGSEAPGLTYRFRIDRAGDYRLTLFTAPNNPIRLGSPVHLGVQVNGTFHAVQLLPSGFRAGENSDPDWGAGVLNQIHTASLVLPFDAGVQELTVLAQEPGTVLEKIELRPADAPVFPSYLGAPVCPCAR